MRLIALTDETGRRVTNSKQVRRQTKSGRSRSFPIHPELQSVLTALPQQGSYVFRGPHGGRLKPDTVRRLLIRDVLKPLAARFPGQGDDPGFIDGRLHSFRHYFCSLCANRGVPEQTVMLWLGHRASDMVRHYYHLHDVEARRQMDRLEFFTEDSGSAAVNT